MQKLSLGLLLVLFWVASGALAQGTENTLPDAPGRIVFIGEDFNVYTRSMVDGATAQITDDASDERHYQWPTWSVDGRLAYFCCDLEFASTFDSQAFISSDGESAGDLAYSGSGESIIYASWSPETCGDTCLDLALLVNNVINGALTVSLVRDTVDDTSFSGTTLGSPFYYSWSPDGGQMVFHRNSRNIEVFDLATGEIDTLISDNSGAFQAPMWSPVDGRLLYGRRNAENRFSTDLVVSQNGEETVLIEAIEGVVSFLWSPDGQYIAYRAATRDNYGSLFVIDAQTGQIVSRSSVNNILSFFWSPDSNKVAYITLSQQPDQFSAFAGYVQNGQTPPAGLAWYTVDLDNGLNRFHTEFFPTNEMIYMMLYFDQFAQSHRVWSPDSSHLVYSEIVNTQPVLQVVSVIDTTDPEATPVTAGRGVLGIWSFN